MILYLSPIFFHSVGHGKMASFWDGALQNFGDYRFSSTPCSNAGLFIAWGLSLFMTIG
jgi:hypothetical protein